MSTSPDPDIEPKDPYAAPPAGCGCLLLFFAFACSVALAVGAALPLSMGPGAVPMIVAVLGVLFAKVAIDRLRGWAGRPLLPVATSFGAVFFGGAASVITSGALHEEVARLHGSPVWGAVITGYPVSLARWILFVPGLIVVVAVGSAFGFGIALLFRKDKLVRDLGAAARGATLLCAALFVWGCLRFALTPTLDVEMARLSGETSTLWGPGKLTEPGELPTIPWGKSDSADPVSTGTYRTVWGERTIVQTCILAGCRVGIVDGGDTATLPETAAFQGWGEELLLTHDTARDRIYVRGRSDRLVRSELRHMNGRWVPGGFDPRPIAHNASPVGGFLLLAAFSLALAGAMFWKSRALAKEQAALEKARVGTLGEDGWILLAGGETARFDVRVLPPPGPVVVLENSAQGTAYRDRALSAADVRTGTLEEHKGRLQVVRSRAYSWALAAAFLGGAPLAASIPAGLMGPFGGGSPRPMDVAPKAPMDGREKTIGQEPEWAVLPGDAADVNGDGVDDLLAICEKTTWMSGPHVMTYVCALDGRTMKPLWRRPAARKTDVLVRAGDHLFVGVAGKEGESMELGSAASVLRFPDLPSGDICTTESAARVWITPPVAPTIELDLTTGKITPSASAPHDCRSVLPAVIGRVPLTSAETLSLTRLGVRKGAVIRAPKMTLVSAIGTAATRQREPLPTVVGLDSETSEVRFTAALPGMKPGDSLSRAPEIVLAGDTVFVLYGSVHAHVAAIDTANGAVRWNRALLDVFSSREPRFLATSTRVFIETASALTALDAKTGEVATSLDHFRGEGRFTSDTW